MSALALRLKIITTTTCRIPKRPKSVISQLQFFAVRPAASVLAYVTTAINWDE